MEIEGVIKRVRYFMTVKGVSPSVLAERAGMAQPSISRFLAGKIQNPTLSTLSSIADALDVPLRNLFPHDRSNVNGYIEHDGGIERIRDFSDLERIVSELRS